VSEARPYRAKVAFPFGPLFPAGFFLIPERCVVAADTEQGAEEDHIACEERGSDEEDYRLLLPAPHDARIQQHEDDAEYDLDHHGLQPPARARNKVPIRRQPAWTRSISVRLPDF